MRSQSYDRDKLRESPMSRSRSLDTLMARITTHPFTSLTDANDKLLCNTRRSYGMSFSSNRAGGARLFRVSPVDLAMAAQGRKVQVYTKRPVLRSRNISYKVVDVSILRAIKQGLLLQTTRIERKEVTFPAIDIRSKGVQNRQDRGCDARFPFWMVGDPGVDMCKEIIERYNYLDVLQAPVMVSTPVPANTMSLAPTYIHNPAPYEFKKPIIASPQMKSVACQTPLNLYLDSNGTYKAVQPPSQRKRVPSAAQVKRQNLRCQKHVCQVGIIDEFFTIAKENRVAEDRSKFYSVPLDFSLAKNKARVVMLELTWSEGEFLHRVIDQPGLIKKILYLHNLRPIQARLSDECEQCAICREHLLWIGDLRHVTQECSHLLHRGCLEDLVRRTNRIKHVTCPVCRCTSHLFGKGGDQCDWIDPEVPNPVSWYEGNEEIYSGAGGGIDDLDEDEWNFVHDYRPSRSFPSRWW